MGRRSIRVVLALALMLTAFASIYVAGAAAPDAARRGLNPDHLRLDGYSSTGRIHYPDLSQGLVRAIDENREPQVIVGPDTRAQVTDTTMFPYSAIALVELYEQNPDSDFDLVGTCSAAMVGPNVLLTAAHCLWDDLMFDGFVDAVAVIPGANGDAAPFGFHVALNYWIPDEYVTNSEVGSPYDYGLITLESNAVEMQTGSLELGILTTGELQDPAFNPVTAGYPGDKPYATQWVSSEAAFTSVDDSHLIHEIDAVQGQSGSPVWRASDLAVVGVESAEGADFNGAVRLDLPIIYDLLGACQELSCTINHFLTDIPGDGGAYNRVWTQTDQLVMSGAVQRTLIWGPQPISKVMLEPYVEAPNGFRTVLYHEKARMEITDPNSDPNSVWYVTNGLASVELMTGNLQVGNNAFEQHPPAEINVAGDGNDPDGPTYVTFAGLRSLPPHSGGSTITATVDRAGNIGNDASLAAQGVTAAHLVPETQHYVASVFWDFMNSSGPVIVNGQQLNAPLFNSPFFATGLPITEAYWADVRVGGTQRTVLVQAFERRVLTYTPGNPPGYLVEAGNVGMHYKQWRDEVTRPGSSGPSDPWPAVGELVASADLSTWPMVETTFGDVGAPYEGGYRMQIPPLGYLQVVANDVFGDGFFTVETRMAQPSPVAGAVCLIFRADPNEENPLFNDVGYWFCLLQEGPYFVGAYTIYETTSDLIELGGAEFNEPLPAATDWHQIGVIAQGNQLWFVVNDAVLGGITHDIGPGAGQIGIQTLSFDGTEGGPVLVAEYRNLEVYSLAN